MKCANCGFELKAGSVYCPSCGKEVKVDDSTILEDDLLSDILDEENDHSSGIKTKYGKTDSDKQKKNERENRKATGSSSEFVKDQRRRKRMFGVIICLICLAIVLAAVLIWTRMNSFTSLYEKARICYNSSQYEQARDMMEKALKRSPMSVNGHFLYAQIFEELGDTDSAEQEYLRTIKLDPDSKSAYTRLLALYWKQNEYDKILELSENVSDDNILKLFEQYIVSSPSASPEGGSFDAFIQIELTADRDGLTIYYTLDGSDPTKEGKKYEDAISVDSEGTFTLKAVCMDEKGNYSDEMEQEYQIDLEQPDAPEISPDGGKFAEGQKIKISAQSGTTVYYTWDGSTPTVHSSKYTSPIEMPEGNNILTVIAVNNSNGAVSQVVKTNFIYYPQTQNTSDSETAMQNQTSDSGQEQQSISDSQNTESSQKQSEHPQTPEDIITTQDTSATH